MVWIKDRPFMDILIDYIAKFGFRRFILCTGYKADFIKRYYQDRNLPLTIVFSEEKNPLGTAGAIKNASSLVKSNTMLVFNGDSFCKADLNKFVDFHFAKNAEASIVLSKLKDNEDYGAVRLGPSGIITSFNEKSKQDGFTNAGIYFFKKSTLDMIPDGVKFSVEYDLFPKLVGLGFFGYKTKAIVTDIGTPQRYKEARLSIK